MKNLGTITDADFELPFDQSTEFKTRGIATAIVTNKNGETLVICSGKFGHYEFPGGGLEEGETAEEAAMREIREETGYNVVLTGEIGIITEYKQDYKLKNIIHAFTGELVNKKQSLKQVEWEKDLQLEIQRIKKEKLLKKFQMMTLSTIEQNLHRKEQKFF